MIFRTKEKLKQNKAITLIALIVTIIILLILATIVVIELKNTKLLSKTKEAKNKYGISVNEENNTLDGYSNAINRTIEQLEGEAPDAKIEKYEKSEDYLFGAKIKVSFIKNEEEVDYENCGYAFSESKGKIGTNKSKYKTNVFSAENEEIEVAAKSGKVYLHILATNVNGNSKEVVSENAIEIDSTKDFTYTGSEQSAKLLSGEYKIECWGAGGRTNGYATPGLGAYTEGSINLKENKQLSIYVGEAGDLTSSNYNTNTFNGGGYTHRADKDVARGGGATDIRLTGGTWSTFDSLKSRIMVAGAGGSGSNSGSGSIKSGGSAGRTNCI